MYGTVQGTYARRIQHPHFIFIPPTLLDVQQMQQVLYQQQQQLEEAPKRQRLSAAEAVPER